jgi:hypothetical protein
MLQISDDVQPADDLGGNDDDDDEQDEAGSERRGSPHLDDTPPPTPNPPARRSSSTPAPKTAEVSSKSANTSKSRKGGSAVLEQVESMVSANSKIRETIMADKARNKLKMQRELFDHQTSERRAAETEAARRREHEERMLDKQLELARLRSGILPSTPHTPTTPISRSSFDTSTFGVDSPSHSLHSARHMNGSSRHTPIPAIHTHHLNIAGLSSASASSPSTPGMPGEPWMDLSFPSSSPSPFPGVDFNSLGNFLQPM